MSFVQENEKLEAGDFVGYQEYSPEIQAQAHTTLARGDNDINLLQGTFTSTYIKVKVFVYLCVCVCLCVFTA